MTDKEKFIEIYRDNIKREGAENLLKFLSESDFFQAPASRKYHECREGGLCRHSLNVYYCLKDFIKRDSVREKYGVNPSEESIAIVSLLHDLCKVNFYKPNKRSVKLDGKWTQIDSYEIDDTLPYGHGEKSVYIAEEYIKLTREEAFAIRYHMGFSDASEPRNVSKAFVMYPLAYCVAAADMEATFFVEQEKTIDK